MKTNYLFALIFICRCVFSQTSVPAGNVNGTWTQAGSPYNVQGNIQIPNNDSLIIQPGVTVIFQGTFKLLVLGKIKAIGTAADTIRFTSSTPLSTWKGINFYNTLSTNDSSKFIYCKLQNGSAIGSPPEDNGGALYVGGFSKLRISHCLIRNCSAKNEGTIYLNSSNAIVSANSILKNYPGFGGGVSTSFGNPVISYNLISDNTTGIGGGVYVKSGSPAIIGNTISNNYSGDTGGGGGICIGTTANGTVTIKGNKILNNTAVTGGGIYSSCTGFVSIISNTISGNGFSLVGGIFIDGKALISHNVISGNNSYGSGGGIACVRESVTISYNFICNNFAFTSQMGDEGGGGLFFSESDSTTRVHNNVIANNGANFGAGIFCYEASPLFINNTIVNNKAGVRGGAVYCYKSSPLFVNCILYGNTTTISGKQVSLYGEVSDPEFYYCDVEGGSAAFDLNGGFYSGVYDNNIDANPGCSTPSASSGTVSNGLAADWSLSLGSPCIEAGDPAGTYPPSDIFNSPRLMGLRADIGAYEYIMMISGFQENSIDDGFTVFPIPTTSDLNIRADLNITGITFVNEYGVEVYHWEGSGSTTQSLNISSLTNGIYFARIISEKGSTVRKFIVMKK